MDLRHVILTLQSARDGNERIKVAAIDTALDYLAKAEPQPAPADANYLNGDTWLADALNSLESDRYERVQALAAIAQAQAAERQAVAMEELAKTVKSIYKHGGIG